MCPDMDNVFSAAPVIEESVSAVTSTPSVDLGTRITYKGEEYVYAYNSSDTQMIPGNGVRFVTACSGYSVAVTSLTDVANPCLGVVQHSTFATNQYGWILTRGFRNVVMVSATTGDFLPIGLGAGGKFVLSETPLTNAGNVGTGLVAGYARNANTGAGGTVYAMIKTGF